ncbi:phage integrase SAM-like domain-containing protein, partial [Escherichia coli]
MKEYYNNFQYFMEYIGRELSAKEMTTEVFTGWISYMCEELDYSPATVNIRVRTMRSFLRYVFEDKQTPKFNNIAGRGTPYSGCKVPKIF